VYDSMYCCVAVTHTDPFSPGKFLLRPGMGAKYFDQRVCMSLSVCLSVCPFAYLKNHTSKFHQIFCVSGRGSVLLLTASDMLCISGFVDDVIFSRNRANDRPRACFVEFAKCRLWGRSLPSPTASCYRACSPTSPATLKAPLEGNSRRLEMLQ